MSQPDRRQFARSVALSAAPFLAGTAGVEAREEKKDPPRKEKEKDGITDPVEALFALVQIRYGKFLSEEQLKRVRRSLAGGLRTGRSLANFKLNNSDDPVVSLDVDLP